MKPVMEKIYQLDWDYPNPFKDELAEVTSQLGDAQGQLAIIKLRGEVKKDYKLTEKQADEVIGYAADVHAESGRIITPHEAYKILQFDKLENSCLTNFNIKLSWFYLS